jgi:hypothetical protein
MEGLSILFNQFNQADGGFASLDPPYTAKSEIRSKHEGPKSKCSKQKRF